MSSNSNAHAAVADPYGWQILSNPYNDFNSIRALAEWNNMICKGMGGGSSIIECFDGNVWDQLDPSFNTANTYSLTVWTGSIGNNRLIAGNRDGQVFVYNSVLDSWSNLGSPSVGLADINSLITWTGPIGNDQLCFAANSGNVKCYDGNTWSNKVWPNSGSVQALTIRNNLLCAGDDLGQVRCSDGVSFGPPLINQLSFDINALAVWNNELCAGYGQSGSGGIACFDNAATTIDSYGEVFSLAVWNNQLCAGYYNGEIKCFYGISSASLGDHGDSVNALALWNGNLCQGNLDANTECNMPITISGYDTQACTDTMISDRTCQPPGADGIPPNAILRLSSDYNAHVEAPDQTSLGYQYICTDIYSDCEIATNCGAIGKECLGSISSLTNAHVGDCNAYSNKICCTSLEAPQLNCAITSAIWTSDAAGTTQIVNSVNEGTVVYLTAQGNNLCTSGTAGFTILEDDLIDDHIKDISLVVFNETTKKAIAPWTSEWQCDGRIPGTDTCTAGDPEYFFRATTGANPPVRSSPPDLVVTQTGTDGDDCSPEDGICQPENGETNENCPQDCRCGDGVLNPLSGEICDDNDTGLDDSDDIFPVDVVDCSSFNSFVDNSAPISCTSIPPGSDACNAIDTSACTPN